MVSIGFITKSKDKMYRYRYNKTTGFVNGIRLVILRDNESETCSDNSYERHALYSSRFIEKYNIEICIIKQKKQLEYRNLFHELPS